MPASALVWLRRDLRCHDHAALYHALRRFERVYCVFVFDTDILDALPTRGDRRVEFIHASVCALDEDLRALAARSGAPGGGLIVRHGTAVQCIVQLARSLGVREVLANRDYEPAALARDRRVADGLAACGIAFSDYKDQVLTSLLSVAQAIELSGLPPGSIPPALSSGAAWAARSGPACKAMRRSAAKTSRPARR